MFIHLEDRTVTLITILLEQKYGRELAKLQKVHIEDQENEMLQNYKISIKKQI